MNNKYVITNPDGSIQIMNECNYVKSVIFGFHINTFLSYTSKPGHASFTTIVDNKKEKDISGRFEWSGIFEEFELIDKERNFDPYSA